MKTAISLPDDLFEAAERLVRESGGSRSELYAAALREYVSRHSPDEVTEALNAVVDQVGDAYDRDFLAASARHVLADSEW